MVEVEKQARVLRTKFNKRFINRIVIVGENGKTWKGKILDVLDHETFSVENQTSRERPVQTVDIYQIYRVV
tara:strand:+ start:739 stop:951 length:213 start_codon:yes stop_codon:yes gene_type:complete